MPIPVRTCKIGNLVFNVNRGGNQPVSSSIEKRSHRYLADLVGTLPLFADPGKVFFQKFDFDAVLPASKTGDTGVQPPGIVKI
jgi:hypothetical protein